MLMMLQPQEMLIFSGGMDTSSGTDKDIHADNKRFRYKLSLFDGDEGEVSKKHYTIYKDKKKKNKERDKEEDKEGDKDADSEDDDDDLDYKDRNVEVLAFNEEDHLLLYDRHYASLNFPLLWFNYLSTLHKPGLATLLNNHFSNN